MAEMADAQNTFLSNAINEIESWLNKRHQDRWQRLSDVDIRKYIKRNVLKGWLLSIPEKHQQINEISYLHILVDVSFPISPPRIALPEAPQQYIWPHVETDGVLCLRPNPADRNIDERLEDAISQVCELLNGVKTNDIYKEFVREFYTYWDNLKTDGAPIIKSLVSYEEKTKEVFYWWGEDHIIFGDTEEQVIGWVKNTGVNIKKKNLRKGWCEWKQEPPSPIEYPENLKDCISFIGEVSITEILNLERSYPILFVTNSDAAPIYFALILKPVNTDKILNGGFRNIKKIPQNLLFHRLEKYKISRAKVERVDSAWIHGRDLDNDHEVLKNKKVALVGCGSLGSLLLNQLIKTGIGEFILIDNDFLKTGNISRHLLGITSIGQNKAKELAAKVKSEHPQVKSIFGINGTIERLNESNYKELSNCDLIISAGIDWVGDYFLSNWRHSLVKKMPIVYLWTEAFALAGHAVAIFEEDSLLCHFSQNGDPAFHATVWDDNSELVEEAGCGNTFQPHGIVDLNFIVNLGAKLILDIFLGNTHSSERRTWLTSKMLVESVGGKCTDFFNGELQIKKYNIEPCAGCWACSEK